MLLSRARTWTQPGSYLLGVPHLIIEESPCHGCPRRWAPATGRRLLIDRPGSGAFDCHRKSDTPARRAPAHDTSHGTRTPWSEPSSPALSLRHRRGTRVGPDADGARTRSPSPTTPPKWRSPWPPTSAASRPRSSRPRLFGARSNAGVRPCGGRRPATEEAQAPPPSRASSTSSWPTTRSRARWPSRSTSVGIQLAVLAEPQSGWGRL